MYLYTGKKCREGDPINCSRGKNSCPPGVIGGWGCDCDEKHLGDKKRELAIKVIEAMSAFLIDRGWIWNVDSSDEAAMFHFIDPKTKIAHRADFAYIIQSEREIK